MTQITADAVKQSIMKWPGRYETLDGRVFLGMPVSQVPSQLIQTGWRNVSHLNASDFRAMGLEVVTARYVGGVCPKKFCRVVVAGVACSHAHPDFSGPCLAVCSDPDIFTRTLAATPPVAP